MKSIFRFVLAAGAVAACTAAAAQPFDTADQQRRDRNREEIMARHGDTSNVTYRSEDADRTTLRQKTHRAAEKTRGFTHRQAEKMRHFGDRQNARYGTASPKQPTPQNDGPR